MSRELAVAAIQMDATPAPIAERLTRAASQIAQAAQRDAKLVVLPQQFATGTSYDDIVYEQTEPLDGAIVQWMRAQAAEHAIYLAGSLLIWDIDETYHAALLVAPDGKFWRYDQQFPYLWERTFYRDGERLVIADTALGKIGLLLGWDAAHPDLWERYAARVDLMLVLHNTPDWSAAELVLKDEAYPWQTIGFGIALQDHATPIQQMQEQARWMGVPLIVAGGSGMFESILPAPRQSLAPLIALRDDLWSHLEQAHLAQLRAPLVQHTAIYDADGQCISQPIPADDGAVVGTLTIAEKRPLPQGEQPESAVSLPTLVAIDALTSAAMSPIYQRGVRRQWGARMAPVSHKTRVWLWTAIVGTVVGFLLGRWSRSMQR